jgi:EAL domain-containing protein (putative c-di-GMP-specific phosphodiesterase class I)
MNVSFQRSRWAAIETGAHRRWHAPAARLGPASEIKLDRALLQDIESSDNAKIIVETAIKMGQGLGYQVVAEGIETEHTARLIKSLGAEMMQGYWICPPRALEELKAWMEAENEVNRLIAET